MKKVLKKILRTIFSYPLIKRNFEKFAQFYGRSCLGNIEEQKIIALKK